MNKAVRSLVVFSVAFLPVPIFVFLLVGDFFGAWYGTAVSVKPATTENPASFEVLIVEPGDDDGFTRRWPADVVRKLALPNDEFGLVPSEIDSALPETRKDRYSLGYTIEPEEGATISLPTTSPTAFGLAVLAYVLGIFGRNMIVAGSPFSLEPTGVYLPKGQAPSGQVAPSRGSRPQKGPPPSGRRKGRGRR
ncbi:MAG: hypothetical protein AAF211_16075 [Myxococcota bacterium]